MADKGSFESVAVEREPRFGGGMGFVCISY